MKMPLANYRLYAIIFALLCITRGATAEDNTNSQQSLWNETRNLLQRREYSLAVNLLENGLDDPSLIKHTKRIQEDLDAVKLLRKFATRVDYSLERLPEAKPLTVLSKNYLFQQLIRGNNGKIIVLTDSRGDDVYFTVNRLDSATWLQIGEPEISDWPEKDFIMGVFLAFDKYPNPQLARTKFNAAAESGQNVIAWIKRLDEAEQQRKQNTQSDPNALLAENPTTGKNQPAKNMKVVGTWHLTFGSSTKPTLLVKLESDGTSVASDDGGNNYRTWGTWGQLSPNEYIYKMNDGGIWTFRHDGEILTGKQPGGKGKFTAKRSKNTNVVGTWHITFDSSTTPTWVIKLRGDGTAIESADGVNYYDTTWAELSPNEYVYKDGRGEIWTFRHNRDILTGKHSNGNHKFTARRSKQ